MVNIIVKTLKKLNLQREEFFNELKNYKYKKIYDLKNYENEQNLIYKKFNLDRLNAFKKIKKLKSKYMFLNHDMSSEHEIFFSALSNNFNYLNILEIGTFDGLNSFLLSKLFPNSKILTIDLKENDKLFKNTYNRNRKDYLKKFIKERDLIIKKSKNIIFKDMNSINLLNHDMKYDLVWIDGAHNNPTVTIDIINSLKLVKSKSVIMCDDIYINKQTKQKSIYRSTAAYETIELLKKENIIDSTYIYKRLDSKSNANPIERKFIAIINMKN